MPGSAIRSCKNTMQPSRNTHPRNVGVCFSMPASGSSSAPTTSTAVWRTILHKRENFRNAFDQFDPDKIAQYDENHYQRLLSDAGIIRNQAKIKATIGNARAYLKIREEFGTVDSFIWSFTNNKVIHNSWKTISDIPARTELSDQMSGELIKRGFKFAGSTICYAFIQAIGMVNDHVTSCFRHKELKSISKPG